MAMLSNITNTNFSRPSSERGLGKVCPCGLTCVDEAEFCQACILLSVMVSPFICESLKWNELG